MIAMAVVGGQMSAFPPNVRPERWAALVLSQVAAGKADAACYQQHGYGCEDRHRTD
jgi:hypothetical protein